MEIYEKALNNTEEALQLSELMNKLWAKSIDTVVGSDIFPLNPAISLCASLPPPSIESESQLHVHQSLSVFSSNTNVISNGSTTEEDDGLIDYNGQGIIFSSG